GSAVTNCSGRSSVAAEAIATFCFKPHRPVIFDTELPMDEIKGLARAVIRPGKSDEHKRL
ncbi:MAG: hypothetical protein WBA73_09310, partial [Devosia sp.]